MKIIIPFQILFYSLLIQILSSISNLCKLQAQFTQTNRTLRHQTLNGKCLLFKIKVNTLSNLSFV